MNKLSFIFLLFLSGTLLGQEQAKKIDVKLFTNFDFTPKYIYLNKDTNWNENIEYNREINGFNFSPAIVFHNKKGNYSEIEISRLNYKSTYNEDYFVLDSSDSHNDVLSSEYKMQFEIFLRYEYKIVLFKKKDWKKLKPIIGFSATPFYHWEKEEPMVSSGFSKSASYFGLSLSLVPRVRYNLNEKWYLDFNVPVSLFNLSYNTFKNENPAISIENRRESSIDFYNTPIGFAVRFGVGYML